MKLTSLFYEVSISLNIFQRRCMEKWSSLYTHKFLYYFGELVFPINYKFRSTCIYTLKKKVRHTTMHIQSWTISFYFIIMLNYPPLPFSWSQIPHISKSINPQYLYSSISPSTSIEYLYIIYILTKWGIGIGILFWQYSICSGGWT